MFGPERYRNLAHALPVAQRGRVVDLGCGAGSTLVALRERLGPDAELVGVDVRQPALPEPLAGDAKVDAVVADLNQRLPFADAGFDAAVCHNTLECLSSKEEFLREVERILVPGGHLLLGHADFDTIVFNSSDLHLTRRLVHAYADTQEAWMDASDGTIGRKLVGIARRSPLEVVETFGWVGVHTDFEEGGAAHAAVQGIAGAVRRDHHEALAAVLDEWVADLRELAARGAFFFSINDYAVLLRKAAG